MTQSEQDLDTYMAIACAVAVEEAKLMPTTPDIQRRAHVIAEAARDRIALQRREERAKRPSNIVSGAIRAAIMAMTPVHVLARLGELRTTHPEMQLAFRNFEHMSEDDLRSALEDIESLIERGA